MTGPTRLPRQYFFDAPVVDAIVNSLTGLAMELSVVRERLDTLERALAKQGIAASDLIEDFEADAETKRARTQARLRIIRSTLDPLKEHFAKPGQEDERGTPV